MNRGLARAAAAVGLGVDIAYLFTIANQGDDFAPRVVFIATFIAVMAVLAVAAAVITARDAVLGQAFLVAAATGLLVSGALALASIGILLILSGMLGFAAAAGTRRLSWRVTIAISIVVTAVFLGGIALT